MGRTFTYAPTLYLGEGITEQKLGRIKERLRTRLLWANVHLLTLARSPKEQLEILDARQLAQPHYAGHTFHVVGIASDWEGAVMLVERIARECLAARGDCALKEYLSC